MRIAGQTDDDELKVRIEGGSYKYHPSTGKRGLSLSVQFPEGTTETEAKDALNDLIGTELILETAEGVDVDGA